MPAGTVTNLILALAQNFTSITGTDMYLEAIADIIRWSQVGGQFLAVFA